MLKLLRKYFLTGLLAAAPVVVTAALVWAIVSFTDRIFVALIPSGYEPAQLLGMEIPGLGLLVTLLGLTFIGALISNFFGRFFMRQWDRLVARLPIISGVYGAIKQVLHSVLSEHGQSFREVVYVEYPQPGQFALGFVIGPAPHANGLGVGPMVAVYVPLVPVPTSGVMLFLPQDKLLKSNMTVEEGLKLTVTLGLVRG